VTAIPVVPDGLMPPRPDWMAGATSVHFTKLQGEGQPDVWAMIVDTSAARLVTFWPPAELEALLRQGLNSLGVLPDGLVLAGPDDLRNLGSP